MAFVWVTLDGVYSERRGIICSLSHIAGRATVQSLLQDVFVLM